MLGEIKLYLILYPDPPLRDYVVFEDTLPPDTRTICIAHQANLRSKAVQLGKLGQQ
jgi:hypothetical protein